MTGIIGAIVGAAITSVVALFIHFHGRPKRRGLAYKVLRDLQKHTEQVRGEFFHSKSASVNYEIAQHLYRSVAIEIVATAFHENPAMYGENDLVKTFHGRDFTRITCENVCNNSSHKAARTNLQKHHTGARFIVLPMDAQYVRIDGMFCRFRDETFLCFISFRNPDDPDENYGILFRDDIAVNFFEYYKSLAKRFREPKSTEQSATHNH